MNTNKHEYSVQEIGLIIRLNEWFFKILKMKYLLVYFVFLVV